MTAATTTARAAAMAAYEAGLAVLPPKMDGTKAPIRSWKDYQDRRPTLAQLQRWYDAGNTGVGLITGRVSGNEHGALELLEFDDRDTYHAYIDAARATGLGDLVELVEDGYCEDTPAGGVHWLYRCPEVTGNTKLARRPKRPEERQHARDNVQVLIETRGEGGYVIVAPSNGHVHPSGGAYQLRSGGLDRIIAITPADRAALFTLARTFDELPPTPAPEPASRPTHAGDNQDGRPGDEFNQRAHWRELLEPHGWTLVFQRGETGYWRRPGKPGPGWSATTNHGGHGYLIVFSSSTPFEPDRGYSPFGAYSVLEHGGDFTAGARALRERGYGAPAAPPPPRPPTTTGATADEPDDPEPAASTVNVLAELGAPVVDGYVVPDAYVVTNDEVIKLTQVRQKDTSYTRRDPVASSPCLVTGILRDPAGDELVEVAWHHYGRWRRRAVARSVIRSGRRMVTQLGDAGFPIMDSSARAMERWLDAVEAANRSRLPVHSIARHLGWQRDGTFVTGDGPWPVHPAAGDGLEHVIAAHARRGDLTDWRAIAVRAERHPLAVMAIYAALAAPLLRWLGLPSFTVDLSGLTTTGKTTAAELGLSVWADPQKAIAYWNSTRVAHERRLSLSHGLPVVIDETSNAPTAEIIRDLLYSIPQGQQKARGTLDGTRPALTWETIVITTGERPIISWSNDGGTAGRVLTLEGAPFGEDGGPTAVAVREGCYTAHGTAGPAFIAHLQPLVKNAAGRQELRELHQSASALFATGSNLNRRRAPLAAALYVAATLADRWAVLPFPPPAVPVWTELLSADDPRDDRPAAALERIHTWIAANPHRIHGRAPVNPRTGDVEIPASGWAGRTLQDGAVAVFEEEVRRELTRSGFELEAVKAAWAETGGIRRQGRHLTRPVRFDGELHRMLVLEPLTQDEDGEDADD